MRKKLFTFVMSFVTWLCVPWTLHAAVYFSENFDTLKSGIPIGWDNTGGTTTDATKQWSYFVSGRSGACLRFDSYYNPSGNTGVLKTPVLSLDVNSQLSFWYINNTGGDFSVYVSTDGGVTYTDKLLEKGLSTPSATTWTQRVYSLEPYTGQTNVRIIFVATSSNKPLKHMIDDILIEDAATCAVPESFFVSDVSQSSAVLNWTLDDIGAVSSTYDLTVSDDDGNQVISQKAMTAQHVIARNYKTQLSGLSANTKYSVTLRTDCNSQGNGSSDISDVFTFTTLANPVSVPFVMDFNDLDTEIPSGWIASEAGVTIEKYIKYGADGKSMHIQALADRSAYIISPQIASVANQLQVSFMVYGDVDIPFSVGLMSDPFDLSSYEALWQDSVRLRRQWSEVRVNMSVTGKYQDETDKSIVIFVPSGKISNIWIDNIDVRTIPSCPRAEKLKVSDVDSTSCRIDWLSYTDVAQYEARLITSTDTAYQTVSTKPALISNLKGKTNYKISVRALCSQSDKAEWSDPVEFQTQCQAVLKTEFSEEFQYGKFPDCWFAKSTLEGEGNGTFYGDNAWEIKNNTGRNNTPGMTFKRYKAGSRCILVSHPFHVSESGKYDVSFWVNRQLDGDTQEGIRLWISNRPDTVGAQRCELIHSDYHMSPVEQQQGWSKYEYNIQKSGTVYLVFEGITQYKRELTIDDIEVYPAPSCRHVNDVDVQDPTTSGIAVNWTPGDNEQKWILQYQLKSKTDTVVKTEIVQSPQHTINNLIPATQYSLSGEIAAICAVGDTSLYESFSSDFITECLPITQFPYVQGFEESLFPPLCWKQRQSYAVEGYGNDYGDKAWVKNNSIVYVYRGSASAKMQNSRRGTRTLLISPLFNIPSDGNYRVSFQMYRDNNNNEEDAVKIWINDTPDTVGATELIHIFASRLVEPVVPSMGYYCYEAQLPVSGLRYIIVEAHSGGGRMMYIDDIVVEPMLPCDRLQSFSVDSVYQSVARVNPSDDLSSGWQIEYGTKGFTLGTGTQLSSTDEQPIVITGLQPETEYDVYARRDCGADGKSLWSFDPRSLKTLCAPEEITKDNYFFDGFENYTGNQPPLAGCYIQEMVKGMKKFTARTSQYVMGKNVLPFDGDRFISLGSYATQWMYHPVYLKAGENYEVSAYFYRGGNEDASSLISFAYGMKPESDEMNFFVTDLDVKPGGWNQEKGYFNVPADGVYYIGLRVNVDAKSYAVLIDNFTLKRVDCIPPMSFEVLSVSTTSALISWTSQAQQWEIKLNDASFNPMASVNDLFHDTVTVNRFEVSAGLTPNTVYYYSIRSFCDGKPSDWTHVSSFRTNCEAQTLPLTENFEDVEMSAFNCWSVLGEGTYSRDTQRSKYGAASLRTRNVTLVSPELNVATLADKMLNGWVYCTSGELGIGIGVIVNPDNIATYEPIKDIIIPVANQWVEFTALFDVLNGADYADIADVRHVAIVITGEADFFFDELVIEDVPTCSKPTDVTITDITPYTCKLSWQANAGENKWKINVYREQSLAFDTVVTTNPAVISDLLPITKYFVEICGICSASDTSRMTECGQLTTECAPLAIPYEEDFKNNNSSLPQCWEFGESVGGDAKNKWSVQSNAVKYAYTDTIGATAVLQTAEFDLKGLEGALLDISVANYKSQDLEILLSTDNGENYDVVIGKIAETTSSGMKNYRFDISDYVDNDVRFALKAKCSGVYSYVTVNKFVIEPLESCTRPVSLRQTAKSDTSATISVNDTADNVEWELVAGIPGFNPDKVIPQTFSSTTCEYIDLQAYTDYEVYARSVCEDKHSMWRGPIVVKTGCPKIASLPYHESFELNNMSDACFSILNERKDDNIYPLASLNTMANNLTHGKSSFTMSASDKYPLLFVLPEFTVNTNSLMITFDYKNGSLADGHVNLELGVILDPKDEKTFVPLQTYDIVDKFRSEIYRFNILDDEYADARIAFRYGTGKNSYMAWIDNVHIEVDSSCPGFSTFEVKDVSFSEADIKAVTRAENFQIAYGLAGLLPDACNLLAPTHEEFTITGLTKATNYCIYARSICGVDTGMWTEPIYFMSDCDVVSTDQGMVYKDNFDAYENLTLPFPPCYVTVVPYETQGVVYPVLSTSEPQSAPRCMQLNGDNAVALPEFDVDANYLKLSLSVRGSGVLYIGLQDELDIDAPFVPLDTIKVTGSYTRIDNDLSLSGLTGRRIVLRSSTKSGVYIDSVEVRRVTSCFEPRNIRTLDVADSSAVITWTSALDASGFEYRLISSTNTDTFETAIDTVRLTGLLPATEYQLSIRAFCGVTDTTEWAQFTFTTRPVLAEVPYINGFENNEENNRWHLVNGTVNKFIFGKDSEAVKTGQQALYVSDNDDKYNYRVDMSPTNGFVYRTFELDQGTYVISYDWKSHGVLNTDFGRMYLVPEKNEPIPSVETLKSEKLPDYCIPLDRGYLSGSNNWSQHFIDFSIADSGRYNLVVAWVNDNNYGVNPPLAVDDIQVREIECALLSDIKVEDVKQRTAQITFVNDNELSKVEYRLCTEMSPDAVPVLVDTVETTVVDLTNLMPATTYYMYIRPVCGQEAIWQDVMINTPCDPIKVTAEKRYVEGFEDYNDNDYLDRCWTEGYNLQRWTVSAGEKQQGRIPHSGSKYITLARNANNAMLRDFELEENSYYLISAWVRQNATYASKLSLVRVKDNGEKETLSSMDVTDEYRELRYELYVSTAGVHTLGFIGNVGYVADYMCLDDLSITRLSFGSPRDILLDSVSSDFASIVWSGSTDKYQVIFSNSEGKALLDTVVSVKRLDMQDLCPSSSYTVQVRSITDNDSSIWSPFSFSTLCGTMLPNFVEDFENVTTGAIPYCWDNQSGSNLVDMSKNWYVTSEIGNWYVKLNARNKQGERGALRSVPVYIDDTDYNLTFRYRNTSISDILRVCISTDSCRTYADTVLTASTKDEWTDVVYDLNAFANKTIMIEFVSTVTGPDMQHYAAIDDVRINCYKPNQVYNDTTCLNHGYIGHGFSIDGKDIKSGGNYRFEKYEKATDADGCDQYSILNLFVPDEINQVIYDTICSGSVYSEGEFADLNLTESGTYKRVFTSSHGCDSTVTLYLHVMGADIAISDTICEGGSYIFGGKQLSRPGEYRDTTRNAQGCEIITTLHLAVTPRYYEFEKTVCQGRTFLWHDTTLTTTGRYLRNYKTLRGCDSIEVMHFTVLPDTFAIEAEICRGITYPFGAQDISEPGVYTLDYINTLGCDSIIKLTLTVSEPDTADFSDYSCQGYPYTGYGHTDLDITCDTVLIQKLKTAEGCDSVQQVFVDFIETIVVDTIVVSDKPYDFGGTTYTSSGEYTHAFFTSEYGCDSIVNLTLTISTDIDYTSDMPLTIAPNPIGINNVSYIHRTWTTEEQHGLIVEVLNSVGQILSSETPEYYPIVVKSLNVSGIYYIRITTGTGDVYMGKLIVR